MVTSSRLQNRVVILIKKKSYFAAILLFILFTFGALTEYKLGILDQIQSVRRKPAALPKLPLDLYIGFSDSGRYSDIPIIGSPEPDDYSVWRKDIRDFILGETGIIIPREKQLVDYQLYSEKRVEGIRQQFLVFSSFDGTQIPAYIHSPIDHNGLPLPGIVVIPGHVREGRSGIEQLANKPASYQHAAAARLAEAGFITLTFELRGFGYLGFPSNTEHTLIAYNALLEGRSYKELIIRDTQMAVSMLRMIEDVDQSRIGITGTSYGGEIAVNYAALDDSIKAIVFHSFGGGSGLKPRVSGGRINQPHYCHILPVVDSRIPREYWYWMLAPRSVLGIRGESDNHNFKNFLDIYQKGWGGEDGLELDVQTGGHEFFVNPTIEFFKRHL